MPSKPRQKKSDHPQKHPIRIVPLHRPEAVAAPAAAAPQLTYRNGPLLTAVQVFTVFWGSAWQQASNSSLMTQMNQFFDYILASQLMDQLGEYSVPGQAIGHGSRIGTTVLTSPAPGTSVQDSAIQQLIQQGDRRRDPAGCQREHSIFRFFAQWRDSGSREQLLLPGFLRLPRLLRPKRLLCRYALSRLLRLYGRVGCSSMHLPPLLRTNYAKPSPTPSPDRAGMTTTTAKSEISARGKHAFWAITPFSSNGPIGRALVYRS